MSKSSRRQYYYLAPFYDRLMNQDKYQGWSKLIKEVIKKYRVPKRVCLDIACGTGKISEILKKQRFKIIGVDCSKEMLRIARKRLPSERFLCSDMRDFKLRSGKDIVMAVSFYDSLNYLLSPRELLRAFKNIARNLPKGAVFLFDVNTKEHIKAMQKTKPKIFKDKDLLSIFWHGGRGNRWDLKIDLLMRQSGNLYKLYSEEHQERGYSETEIKSFLRKAGFEVLEVRREKKMRKDLNRVVKNKLYFVARRK